MTAPGTPAPTFRRLRSGFLLAAAVCAASGALAGTVASSFPRGHLDWALWGVGLFGAAAVAWLVAGVLGLAARRFDWALLVPPALLAVTVLLGALAVPRQTRFAAARGAFSDVVAARGEAGPGALCPRWIGSYRISRCETVASITRFTTEGGFLDEVGIAYAPDGVPPPAGGDGSVAYELLSGPWYTFSRSW